MIKGLLLDVGGVLMTNGWDRKLRARAAEKFGIELDEMTDRHALAFDTFETGKMTFDDFLKICVFYKPRSFTIEEFVSYVKNEARLFAENVEFFKAVKKKYNLKIGLLSNEGRELAVDRIERFHLGEFADFFVMSSFVNLRKPDPEIYHLALDLMQLPQDQILYVDDRSLLIDMAKSLGFQAIWHQSLEKTQKLFEEFGLNAEVYSH